MYLAGKKAYSTLVVRRGWLGPGQVTMIAQQLALVGEPAGKRCDFATHANDRMNGILGNTLTRAIAPIDRGLIVRHMDTWGYCDNGNGNGNPNIAAPVAKLEN